MVVTPKLTSAASAGVAATQVSRSASPLTVLILSSW